MPTPEDSLSLLDQEPSSLPPRRPKKTKLTPCRFCVGLVLLVLAAFFGIFFYQLGKLAYDFLGKARFPHLAHHHLPLKNETGRVFGEDELVRSFYGREEDGGVEKFDLIATIFHRAMVKNETLEVEAEEGALALKEGEDELEKKRKRKGEFVWGPWERIFSEVVLEGLDLKTKRVKTITKITLPGRIIPSLRNSTQRVDLVASFNLIPSSLKTPNNLIPIDTTNYVPFNFSTRTYPSPWPVLGNTLEVQRETEQPSASWRDQLVQYATIQPLLKEVIPWVEKKEGDEEKKEGLVITMVVNGEETGVGDQGKEGDREKQEKTKDKMRSHAIVTRSMVTMVRDTSVYSLASFKKQMKALGESKQICNDLFNGKRVNLKGGKFPNCRDLLRFDRRGHFQSLFEMGSEEDAALLREEKERKSDGIEELMGEGEAEERKKGEKGWRYGAFIQANAGFPGPADLFELGNGTSEVIEDEPDLTFDWHLTFSTSSPLTVAIAKAFLNSGDGLNNGVSSNRSAHEIAQGQDAAEFSNALLGHPFNPSSRPIVRKALRNLSSVLTFFSALIQLHFWIIRNVTTGLSAPALAIDGLTDYICFLWESVLDYKEFDAPFFLGIVAVTSYSAIVWALVLRIDFSWWGYLPVGFSRRKASHLERASTRVDMRFSWKQRGMVSLFLLTLSFLIPKLPYIIHAAPPLSLVPEEGSLRSSIDKAWYFLYINRLSDTSSNLLFISQFLLNQRSRTFGGSYRVLAAVDLLSQSLHALPVLLSARWGRWELMDPLDVWDVVTLGKFAASAWQAWTFEGPKQEEEEEQ